MSRPVISFLFALLAARAAAAPTGSLVTPFGYENAPGAVNNVIPFSWSSTRYQQIYGASDLQGAIGKLITSIAFRVDEKDGFDGDYAGGFVYTSFSIELSETAVAVESLSTNLDANHGPRRVTVHSGNYSVPFLEGDQLVNPFDLQFLFETPYYYSGGNLLVDIMRADVEARLPHLDAVLAIDSVKRAYRDTISNIPRTDDSLGLITRFQFENVPEPTAGIMLMVGGAALLKLSRRRLVLQKS